MKHILAVLFMLVPFTANAQTVGEPIHEASFMVAFEELELTGIEVPVEYEEGFVIELKDEFSQDFRHVLRERFADVADEEIERLRCRLGDSRKRILRCDATW